jgi:hypothetical protein
MTGSHEVRGSIPLGSTNSFNQSMKDQYGEGKQPEPKAFEEMGLDKVELPNGLSIRKRLSAWCGLSWLIWSRGSS